VCCYRKDSQSSFDHIPNWIAQIERGVRPGQEVSKIMVALADDCGNNAVVSSKQGEQLAAAHGMQFFSSSAKEDKNSTEAINALVAEIKEKKFPGQHMQASSVLQDINNSNEAENDAPSPKKPTSPQGPVPVRPEIEMTESLSLVVDFLRGKKLDRSCDLLLEEWRLRSSSSSSALDVPTKLEGIIAGRVAPAAEGEVQARPLGDLSGSVKLVPGEIGTGDDSSRASVGTVGESGKGKTQPADLPDEMIHQPGTGKLTEVQKELLREKESHPYGGYAVANLKVIYNPSKTGFEESAEYPMKTNQVIAGRYQILDYIGSAAFSHAVQCLDLTTGELVCAKIIKNNKDFLDQGLDEIKLLKLINSSGDVHYNSVVEIFDYFYHKEHLFIICELLRDNLYEVQRCLAPPTPLTVTRTVTPTPTAGIFEMRRSLLTSSSLGSRGSLSNA